MESIIQRIQAFKSDLSGNSPIEVVRKNIIFGDCFVLSQSEYLDLRSKVANRFHLHPNEVLIVGSAKLGFSIVPAKRYRHFSNESDIDIVLISSSLFDQIWHATFTYKHEVGIWDQEKEFKDYLFRGWIRPDKLPPSKHFSICSDWWEFFRELSNTRKYGNYKIAGALYKSWFYLEDYQKICTEDCKREVVGQYENIRD
jgi:hypothetical protein